MRKKGLDRAVALLEEAQALRTRGDTAAVVRDPGLLREGLRYLEAYGYTPRLFAGWQDITLADILKAIQQFKKFFGVRSRGGVFDRATLLAMRQPRCGCPDVARAHHGDWYAPVRRALAKWNKRSLTWALAKTLPGLGAGEQRAAVQAAFDSWTRYGNLDVRPWTTGQPAPDIVITTGRGRPDGFDGPNGILAYAYLPNGSDRQLSMVLDLDELWALNPGSRGILLLNVLAHEDGHLFGLEHSRAASALMAPTYAPGVSAPQRNDDIPRFVARYGERQTPVPPPQPPAADVTRLVVEVKGRVDSAVLLPY